MSVLLLQRATKLKSGSCIHEKNKTQQEGEKDVETCGIQRVAQVRVIFYALLMYFDDINNHVTPFFNRAMFVVVIDQISTSV